MVIDMSEQQLNTVAQLRAFLNGTPEVQFEPIGEDTERYAFIAAVLKRLGTFALSGPIRVWWCATCSGPPIIPASS